MSICGNMVGGLIMPKSFVLEDENGNSFVGVTVGEETIFTADPKTDIREGTIAATDQGVVTGEAVIPNYETITGEIVIMSGGNFSIELPMHKMYDYTEIQCIICTFNTSLSDSVAAEKVVIGDSVYNVGTTDVLATLTKSTDDQTINFNLTNNSDSMCIVRYFTYKELY